MWRVEAADGRAGAIKILISRPGREGQYRLARFKDEIDFLLRHPDFDGVLPMLDGRIADDLSQPSQENGYQADSLIGRPRFMPYESSSAGWLLIPPGQLWPEVEVVVAAALRAMQEDDPIDIAAVVTVNKIIDR